MYRPLSTYRFQFHQHFSLPQAEALLDYLQQLGVKTIYASPVLKSRPGSQHGYDGIDPHRLDPEVADQVQWERFHHQLGQRGMGWLQDIVPNHLALAPQNALLRDVCEKGPQSGYYTYFDIDWEHPRLELHGRLMIPVLGDDLEALIQRGEVKLVYAEGELQVSYYEHCYPLNLESYAVWLGRDCHKYEQLYRWLGSLRLALDTHDMPLWSRLKEKLATFMAKDEDLRTYGERELDQINGQPEALIDLLEQQYFALVYWPMTDTVMNYRRFFTVNDLICLNMQDPSVFAHYHRWVDQEVRAGRIQGLRLDHIDGLYDPTTYLEQLRNLTGEQTYIAAEKILEQEETLPSEWPIQGATGYEFLSRVNKLLTHPQGEPPLTQLYQALTGQAVDIDELIYEKKRHILHANMIGEWDNLFRLFDELDLLNGVQRTHLGDEQLRLMIGEFLLAMPVYRIYGRGLPLVQAERQVIGEALHTVRERHPDLRDAVDLYESWYVRDEFESKAQRQAAAQFLRRSMQFSGPLMAKGLEDTTFYVYHRFIAHNEVGEDPRVFSLGVDAFHRFMQARQQQTPLAMNTLSTHDTKRGEDVRARLQVLSELSQEWEHLVQFWQESYGDRPQPDANDTYFVYQTLAGAWPMDGHIDEAFAQRIEAYLEKALREAKLHSGWASPNQAYEAATQELAQACLAKDSAFRQRFEPFFQKLRDFGIFNSLAQVLLKHTCPGTPDLYQGCESWNLSLVDPDNRRPVDYAQLQEQLRQVERWQQDQELEQKLWKHREQGAIKLWLTQACLQARQQFADLFVEGAYLPLKVVGQQAEHLLAYARRHGRQYALVLLPLYSAKLTQGSPEALMSIDWGDTRVKLPPLAPHDWHNHLSGEGCSVWDEVEVGAVLGKLPFALLTGERPVTPRRAGVLMHLTSLPSAYGCGDLGPQARHFVDWLAEAGQSLWQVLPLNPVNRPSSYSPYSADSAFAGSPLLISPEELQRQGYLSDAQLSEHWLPAQGQADFAEVEAHKGILFEQAYRAFQIQADAATRRAYADFERREAHWLDDYALYQVLKRKFEGKPWYQWPEKTKRRSPEKLLRHRERMADEIGQVKFLQFVFQQQWDALRRYANACGVQIFGDMPIYVSYDSADVWSHPELFRLQEDLSPATVAGVPPDYFSKTGQLWGMPIFAWERHRETAYAWWISRLRRNLAFFDLLRLDHFRAFAAYWEVPAKEKTAIQGRWVQGPGRELFDALQSALGELPIVAEDLGDIDQPVYDLRDAYHFPGMRVLQFAFSPNFPQNLHIPHLYPPHSIAYTGTHDNNTLQGWYKNELDGAARTRLERYLGHSVDKEVMHWEMIRLLYASAAETVIVPLQDILGLGQAAMMNKPGTTQDNWRWRLEQWPLPTSILPTLQQLVKVYGR